MKNDAVQSLHISAAIGVSLTAYYLIPYLLDPYNYRSRFSGPWLAQLTNWWLSNKMRFEDQDHREAIRSLHEKYGTFLRIGPNHISICDPDALEAVYGHGSGLLKTDFYHMFRNGTEANMFTTQDKVVHSNKRRRIANIFSPQNILAFEPRVRTRIQRAIAQLDMRCKAAAQGISGFNWHAKGGGAIVDICPQLTFLGFDIISDLTLGVPFGLITAQQDAVPLIDSDGNPGSKVVQIIDKIVSSGRMVMAAGVYPKWTHTLRRFLPWNLISALGFFDFFRLTVNALETRMKRENIKSYDGKGADMIDKLLGVKNLDGSALSKPEIYTEAVLLLLAGGDTSSSSLGALCAYLAMYPQAQRRLQAELDAQIPLRSSHEPQEIENNEDNLDEVVVKYEQIKNLPYLGACIKEALRLHSPVGTGLPRVVPPGRTFTFKGEVFKAGSIVSVPSFSTHRLSVWGPDAEEFRPERWLSEDASSFTKYFVPFSIGPRACIGRNLANMNMMLIAATIFRRYEIEALPSTKFYTRESFVREAHRCEVTIKRRGIAS